MIRTPRRAASALSVLALLGTLALAACTPSPTGVASLDGGASKTPEASEAPSEGDPVKFTECMREQGIEVPDPDTEQEGFAIAIPQGADKAAVDAALVACKEFMPNGGEMIEPSAEQLAQMRAFAKCMREHGIEDFPDPGADGGIQIQGDSSDPNGIDPMSEEFEDAEQACRHLAPKPPGGGEQDGPSTQTGGEAS